MANTLALNEKEIPEDLRPLIGNRGVKQIIDYQSPYADYSVILNELGRKQNIRVFYLENLRDDWEWVDGTDEGPGFVLLKERDNS